METLQSKLEQSVQDTFKRVEEKSNVIALVNLSNNSSLKKQCKLISMIKTIIIKSLQIGNYKRVLLYLISLNKILDILEKEEEYIMTKMSDIIFH